MEFGVWDALRDILLLLSAALLLGTLAERLGQSVIVGYLLAGTLVGPSMLAWIQSGEELLYIAELGVALLLFVIGLEFSPRLARLGKSALVIGPLQVAVTTAVALWVATLAGLALPEATVVAMMVTMSSTACVLRLLADRVELESLHGRAALGVLLVQDVAVVPMMLVVSLMVGGGTVRAMFEKLALTLTFATLLIGLFYLVFSLIVPGWLAQSAWRRNRDLPALLAMIMALGSAWAAHQLEISPALGAFAAGVLLAISPFATQIRADVRPLSTLLVTLFFASIGMFGDPIWLVGHFGLVAAIVAAIVLGKPIIIFLLSLLFRQPLRYGVAASLLLAQVGEFSFVLATIAHRETNGVTLLSPTTFRAMISATIVTLLLTPYLVANATRCGRWVERWWQRIRRQRRPAVSSQEMPSFAEAPRNRILIIGFGPAGQRVAEGLLRDHLSRLLVLDLNPTNLSLASQYGLAGHLGDATRSDVLEHAGISRAAIVVLTVPDHATTRQLIYMVRDEAPEAAIFVRCRYHIRRWELLLAGADEVVDEEDQVGQELAARVREAIHGDQRPSE